MSSFSFESLYSNGDFGPTFDLLSIENVINSKPVVIAERMSGDIYKGDIESFPIIIKTIKVNRKSVCDVKREICALQLLCSDTSSDMMKYYGYVWFQKIETIAIVCEFINGPTLGQWLLSPSREDSSTTVENSWLRRKKIIVGILNGLKRIHMLGCAHNDLKPGNVILKLPNLVPIILDLGIATLPNSQSTGQGYGEQKNAKLGLRTTHFKAGSLCKGFTLGYVAPERLEAGDSELGVESDQFSDIYSMGALIQNLVTGSLLGSNARLREDTKKEIKWYKGIMDQDEIPKTKNGSNSDSDEDEDANLFIPDKRLPMLGTKEILDVLIFILLPTFQKDNKKRCGIDDLLLSVELKFPRDAAATSFVPSPEDINDIDCHLEESYHNNNLAPVLDLTEGTFLIMEEIFKDFATSHHGQSLFPALISPGAITESSYEIKISDNILYRFIELDFGVSMEKYLPFNVANNVRLVNCRAAVETNRCFFLSLGESLDINPFMLMTIFRYLASKPGLTPTNESYDISDNTVGDTICQPIDCMNSILMYAGFPDVHSLIYLWLHDLMADIEICIVSSQDAEGRGNFKTLINRFYSADDYSQDPFRPSGATRVIYLRCDHSHFTVLKPCNMILENGNENTSWNTFNGDELFDCKHNFDPNLVTVVDQSCYMPNRYKISHCSSLFQNRHSLQSSFVATGSKTTSRIGLSSLGQDNDSLSEGFSFETERFDNAIEIMNVHSTWSAVCENQQNVIAANILDNRDVLCHRNSGKSSSFIEPIDGEHAKTTLSNSMPTVSDTDIDEASIVVATALGWGLELRPSQREILKAQLNGRDVIWNAGTNSGKSISFYGIAVLASLKRFGLDDAKVIVLVPTNTIKISILTECSNYPINCVIPGHGEDLNMSLCDALNSPAQLIVIHPAKLVSFCGIGSDGKSRHDSVSDRLENSRKVNRTLKLGLSCYLVADEAHSYCTLPYIGFQMAMDVVHQFLPNLKSLTACSATLAFGISTVDIIMEAFHMRHGAHIRIESSRRHDIQRIIVNPESIMQAGAFKGAGSKQVFLTEHVIPEMNKLHKWVLSLNGALMVYTDTVEAANDVRNEYLCKYPGVPDFDVQLLFGSNKQSPTSQQRSYEAIDQSEASILVATLVASMGQNLRALKALLIYSDVYCGISMEQLIGRLMRGLRSGTDDFGVVVVLTPTSTVYSDFQNVSSSGNPMRYLVDVQRKALLRKLLFDPHCSQMHLDQLLPRLQIDGEPVEVDNVQCGMCISCMHGIDIVDMTRDAFIICCAVKETIELLPAYYIALLLVGIKITHKLYPLAVQYFNEIFRIPYVKFHSYAALSHCSTQQVFVLIQHLIMDDYLQNYDVILPPFEGNARPLRNAVKLTPKGRALLDRPSENHASISLIRRAPDPQHLVCPPQTQKHFMVDRHGKLIPPAHDEGNRNWITPNPANVNPAFENSSRDLLAMEDATLQERVQLDYLQELEDALGGNICQDSEIIYRECSHHICDINLQRICIKKCNCRLPNYRRTIKDIGIINKNSANLMARVVTHSSDISLDAVTVVINDLPTIAGDENEIFADVPHQQSLNTNTNAILECFTQLGNTSLATAYTDDIISSILGRQVPSSSLRNCDEVNLDDFIMPLDLFIKAIYIEGEGDTSKLKRREGFSLFTLNYFADGDRFIFASNNISHTGYTGHSIMESLMKGEIPQPISQVRSGPKPQIMLSSKCAFSGCPVKRKMFLTDVRSKSNEGIQQRGLDSDIANLASFEIVFVQSRDGHVSKHHHDSVTGSQNRLQLPYDPMNPRMSYVQSKGTSLRIVQEPNHKIINQRCNFNDLPEAMRPSPSLLRIPQVMVVQRMILLHTNTTMY